MDVVSGLNFYLCLPMWDFFGLILLFIVGFFFKPSLLLVCERRCFLLTVTPSWLVKNPGLALLRNSGMGLRGDYSSSSFVQIACG